MALTHPEWSTAYMATAETMKRLAAVTVVPTAMFIGTFAAVFGALWAAARIV